MNIKKFIKSAVLVSAAIIAVVGAIPASAANYDIKHAGDSDVYAYYGTPKLDGVIDDIWSKSTTCYTEWYVNEGTIGYLSFIGTSLEGSYGKAMWDEKNLYFLIVSQDKTYSDVNKILPGEQDKGEKAREYLGEGAQVWVTEAMLDTETYYVSEGNYYMIVYRSETSGKKGQCTIADKTHPERLATETFCDYAVKDYGSYYVIEMAVPWHDITPENDSEIGINYSINDDANGDGWREGYACWTGSKYMGNNNVADLGPVILTGGPAKNKGTTGSTSGNSSGNSSSAAGTNSGDTDATVGDAEINDSVDNDNTGDKVVATGFSKNGLAAIDEANAAVKGARNAVIVASVLLGIAAIAGVALSTVFIIKTVKKK